MLKSAQGPAKRCLSCYCSLRPSEPQKAQPVVVWPPILPLHLKLSTGESTELLRRGTGSVPSAQSTHQYHQKPYTNQSHLKIFGKVSLSTKWLSAASDQVCPLLSAHVVATLPLILLVFSMGMAVPGHPSSDVLLPWSTRHLKEMTGVYPSYHLVSLSVLFFFQSQWALDDINTPLTGFPYSTTDQGVFFGRQSNDVQGAGPNFPACLFIFQNYLHLKSFHFQAHSRWFAGLLITLSGG